MSTHPDMSNPNPATSSIRIDQLALPLCGVGLTIWFWLDLWLGGGLIGGDIYTYYFPQKVFYAEALRQGILPLWNPLVGHGYPFLAESQVGMFYPSNLLLYRFLDPNTAYNLNHLLHYVLAFLFTGLLARELGLSTPAALLAALAFVYGWFAPRCCLEWAIMTGCWFPLSLFLLIKFLRGGKLFWLWLLSISLCLQLLIGHFHLAFITLLTLTLWTLGEAVFLQISSHL